MLNRSCWHDGCKDAGENAPVAIAFSSNYICKQFTVLAAILPNVFFFTAMQYSTIPNNRQNIRAWGAEWRRKAANSAFGWHFSRSNYFIASCSALLLLAVGIHHRITNNAHYVDAFAMSTNESTHYTIFNIKIIEWQAKWYQNYSQMRSKCATATSICTLEHSWCASFHYRYGNIVNGISMEWMARTHMYESKSPCNIHFLGSCVPSSLDLDTMCHAELCDSICPMIWISEP